LVLLEPSGTVRRALRLMRLDQSFLIADDILQARELINNRLHHHTRITALSAHATPPLIWEGEITAANAEEIWAMAQTQIDSFEAYLEPITIDLSGVSFIDSTGAGLLLRVRRYAAEKDAVVYYIDPQPDVRNVLRMSHVENELLDHNGFSHKSAAHSRFPSWSDGFSRSGGRPYVTRTAEAVTPT
jgi:anti-anti-sigma factor